VYDRDTINRKKLGTELGMLRYRVPGLTQEKMARLVGVSPVTIRNWENGTYTPSAYNLKRMIEVCLQEEAFSAGREQEEAEALWAKADLNASFDERWFRELETTYMLPALSPGEYPLVVDGQESVESNYRPAQSLFLFNQALPDPGEFYGRIRERRTLLDRTYSKESSSIVGPAKIGKTWLMDYLRLTAPQELGSRFHVSYVDAMLPSCGTVEGFTFKAAHGFGVPWALDDANRGLTALEQVVASLIANNKVPILCVDTFEALATKTGFDLPFFAGLRALTRVGLCLVTASKKPLIDIVSRAVKESPFFNVFEQLSLEPFTRGEAETFAQAKSFQAGFTHQEYTRLLEYGKAEEQQWSPLRLQLVGKMLLEDKILAEVEGPAYYEPDDPHYWQMFEEQVEKKYRGVVR